MNLILLLNSINIAQNVRLNEANVTLNLDFLKCCDSTTPTSLFCTRRLSRNVILFGTYSPINLSFILVHSGDDNVVANKGSPSKTMKTAKTIGFVPVRAILTHEV